MRVVLIVRDLLGVGLAGRNDADGRTPQRVDDDIGPPIDRAEQPIAVLAIVPPAILRDDPVRVEEGPDGIGEVEAAALETGAVLGLVPFELHPPAHIGQWPTLIKRLASIAANRAAACYRLSRRIDEDPRITPLG